jgi:hypothetical protein
MEAGMWQDVVIGIGQWIFVFALIPSILSEDKPNKLTSFLTAGVMSAFAVAFGTLHMVMSTVSALVVAIAWWILFIQKVLED